MTREEAIKKAQKIILESQIISHENSVLRERIADALQKAHQAGGNDFFELARKHFKRVS